MYCKNCGAAIPNRRKTCQNCGTKVEDNGTKVEYNGTKVEDKQTCPETHLSRAIVVTLLCCWLFGILAIINATGVESAFNAGNYGLALERSKSAEKWCDRSLIVGIIFWMISLIVMMVAMA